MAPGIWGLEKLRYTSNNFQLLFSRPVWSFPVATVTNYHKLTSLKQQEFMHSYSGGQKFNLPLAGLFPGFNRAALPLEAPGKSALLVPPSSAGSSLLRLIFTSPSALAASNLSVSLLDTYGWI